MEAIMRENNAMEELIKKYKEKIASLVLLRNREEKAGRSGYCISITGEIQAYNAVISDLQRLKQ